MIIYICNAFSPGMLNRRHQARDDNERGLYGARRCLRPVDDPIKFLRDHARAGSKVLSIVGHPDTAAVFSAELGFAVETNRKAIRLDGFAKRSQEMLLIGQVVAADGGPYRLPAGTTELPPDASIEWWTA